MDLFAPTPIHLQRQAEAKRLDEDIPGTAFSDGVRRSLYTYALIRNSWGTTNIDAGPIELTRVAELYDAFRTGHTPTGRILPSEVEVLNYFQILEDLPTTRFPLGLDDLRHLHRDYFRDVALHNGARSGLWKQADNEVAGPFGVLKTTPKEKVEAELQGLLDWLNGPGLDLPVLVRGALFFHQFQRIHPFGDGNGRTGRLATLLALSSGGLPNIRYCPIDDAINEDRPEYYRSLSRADHGDREGWVNYFTAQVVAGYRRSHLLGQQLQLIPPGLEDASRRFIEYLHIHKVRVFKSADTRPFFLTTPRRTLTRRLSQLEVLGFIRGTGRGAGRLYHVLSLHELEQLPRGAAAVKKGSP